MRISNCYVLFTGLSGLYFTLPSSYEECRNRMIRGTMMSGMSGMSGGSLGIIRGYNWSAMVIGMGAALRMAEIRRFSGFPVGKQCYDSK